MAFYQKPTLEYLQYSGTGKTGITTTLRDNNLITKSDKQTEDQMWIAKVGYAHPDWSEKFKCQTCGTTFNVFRDDLLVVFKRNDMSRSYDQIIVVCECCHSDIVIDDPAHEAWGELPRKVWCGTCDISHVIQAIDLKEEGLIFCPKGCGTELSAPTQQRVRNLKRR